MTKDKREREKEFMRCLGNGKSIYDIESEEEDYHKGWVK